MFWPFSHTQKNIITIIMFDSKQAFFQQKYHSLIYTYTFRAQLTHTLHDTQHISTKIILLKLNFLSIILLIYLILYRRSLSFIAKNTIIVNI